MSPPPRTSFWRYSLTAELVAAAMAGVLLAAGAWITLRQLEQRYIEFFVADAARVNLYLHEHLEAGVAQLEEMARLPKPLTARSASLLSPSFSDLYLVDRSQRVRGVLKAVPGSRVFPGFSFAGSQIQPYLARPESSSSPITRGLEDEQASVYVLRPLAGPAAGGEVADRLWLLGRLNLDYIEGFLTQFSRFSGTTVLLVTQDGFVMLAGKSQPQVPAVDLNIAATTGKPIQPLLLEGRQWLPLVAPDTGLGARVVSLVPLDRLRQQQGAVLASTGAAAALIVLVLLVKNLQLRRHLFAPVSRFAVQLQHLEGEYRTPSSRSRSPLELPDAMATGAAGDFQEIQQIRASFSGLMRLINQRDQILQRQLRTSLSAAAIAHEISVPLSSIRLLCQLAQRQLGRDGGPLDVDELVANLEDQSQEVNRVVERMRMLLRNVSTELLPTDLSAVASSACIYMKHLLGEQGVQLQCSGLEDGAVLVLGDAAQLQTAITNLLHNAMEAVVSQPPQRRRIQLDLSRRHGDAGDELLLSIADSGPGFSFDPSDETLFQSTKATGSGLGLFVVRTTLANHQGHLEVARSVVLGGAEVRLVLPASPQLRTTPAPPPPCGSPGPGG